MSHLWQPKYYTRGWTFYLSLLISEISRLTRVVILTLFIGVQCFSLFPPYYLSIISLRSARCICDKYLTACLRLQSLRRQLGIGATLLFVASLWDSVRIHTQEFVRRGRLSGEKCDKYMASSHLCLCVWISRSCCIRILLLSSKP